MSVSLLIVDDEPAIRKSLRFFFEKKQYEVFEAETGAEGLEVVRSAHPDVVLLDVRLPDADGLDVLSSIKEAAPASVVLMMTAHGDTNMALEATVNRGAFWFFSKPIEMGMLDAQVSKAVEHAHAQLRGRLAEQRVQALQAAPVDSLGESEAMKAVDHLVGVVAQSKDTTVLILGESGTGKGVVAEAIHRRSPRRDAPFQEINCAGLSETFLETELFGAERGAYTDAKQLKRGLLEIADGGTVFLDEIGDLSPALQPKLLKVLESRRFRRLGGVKDIEVDVRIIAATHKDLDAAQKGGQLRQDLYYRLNVMPLQLPPLRDRGRDVVLLAERFIEHFARALGRQARGITPEVEATLLRHRWPGNVRELKNVIERAMILCGDADQLGVEHLPAELVAAAAPIVGRLPVATAGGDGQPVTAARILTLEELEKAYIGDVLERLAKNRSQTAQALGISRSTLIEKIKKYGLGSADAPA
jgi:DNA-binding NtrC family response regulator